MEAQAQVKLEVLEVLVQVKAECLPPPLGLPHGDAVSSLASLALPLPALLEQVARLRPGEASSGRSVAERAFTVLTERWVATALIDGARLDAATARIAAADGAARDAAVLGELVSLAAPLQYGEDRRAKIER